MTDKSRKRNVLILAGVAALAFLFSLILVREGGPYVSPDETANAFFAQQLAETGALRWFEPLNVVFNDVIHPRSVLSMDGWLVPSGFIGIPALYGAIIAFTGGWLLQLITPILSLLAVFTFYGIVRRLFDDRIALWSGILLATHPAWWYYTARNLMPNVPMTAMVIFACWFCVARPLKARAEDVKVAWLSAVLPQLDYVFAGVGFGLALAIRPTAAIWLGLGAIVLGLFYFRNIEWSPVFLVGFIVLLTLVPFGVLNHATYGSALSAGYFVQESGATVAQTAAAQTPPPSSSLQRLQNEVNAFLEPVLPFGIHPRAMARHLFDYGLAMFWWLTVLALVGLPLIVPGNRLSKEAKWKNKAYLTTGLVVAGWLLVLYGSWTINDNPDASAVTIANSYVRYWLPIYIMAIPAVAYGIKQLTNRAVTDRVKKIISVGLLVACMALNGWVVFFSPEDGLTRAAEVQRAAANVRTVVLEQTEDNALIIVDRGDKIFFPHRRVMYPLRSERTYDLMPALERRVPLYYYGITFPEKDMTYLNNKKLAEMGLQIERLETFEETSLYQITAQPSL
jgi:4-amino-4-deoxy-L-arabinose transferase-like glycosyltransferase